MTDPVRPFTPQQLQVLRLVGEGFSPNAIAASLEIAPRTARSHIAQIALLLPAQDGERSAYQRVLRYAVRRRFGLENGEQREGAA